MKKSSLVILILTLLGVFIGIFVGLLLGGHFSEEPSAALNSSNSHWLNNLVRFPGELFIRSLKLLVLPLVITSMVVGVASLGNIRATGKIGIRVLTFYVSTTLIASLIGIGVVLSIQPGKKGHELASPSPTNSFEEKINNNSTNQKTLPIDVEAEGQKKPLDRLLDVIRKLVPENLITSAQNFNILGLIVFSLAFGIMLLLIDPEKAKPVLLFFDGMNEAIMKLVHLLMFLTPLGVASLIADKVSSSPNLLAELQRLSYYIGSVILGLAIHLCVILPAIYFFFTRKNPFRYLTGMTQALLTALGTSSSAAALPVTMECAELQGISKQSTRFVLPLGATINMDGTALYEAVSVIFIAQMLGHSLSLGDVVVIALVSTLAAVGAAAIPSAGLVTMVMVLTAVGLPPEAGIIYIFAVDWFLDRLRTSVNVAGDSIGAALIDHFESKNLSSS